jgi:hypothetical protein
MQVGDHDDPVVHPHEREEVSPEQCLEPIPLSEDINTSHHNYESDVRGEDTPEFIVVE